MSEEQELLRRGLRELLDRECDARRVRAIAYDGDGRDAALWRSLADAGWTGVAVPEEFGGAGLRFEDVCIVLEEAGRAALPLPLTTSLLVSRLFRSGLGFGHPDSLPHRIARGELGFTLALVDYPSEDSEGHVIAERMGDLWHLSGTRNFVPYGPLADVMLIEADTSGGGVLLALPTDVLGATWRDLNLIDRTVPHYELNLEGAVKPIWESIATGAGAAVRAQALIGEWTVALAAETLGACERMLEMSVAYAKERVQFGRPIGANQAVKIRLADMGAAIERMRAGVYHAAVKIDSGAEDRDLAVAMAKVATAGQGTWLGSQAIHVHGGIGYTWEHNLHLYFKRVKSNELLLGDDSVHLARVADAVL